MKYLIIQITTLLFLYLCVYWFQLQAQTMPYQPIENHCNPASVANVSIVAVGDFPNAVDNGDGTYTKCIDLLADEGIDPTTISSDITASLFYDNGFTAASFSTSNGFMINGATNPQVGSTGNHFAYALLPNDGSNTICATVEVNAAQLAEIGFFLTIEHGDTTGVGITATGFIDNELVYTDNDARECEAGTLAIDLNGTATDLGTINLSFSMSEVELNDARTIDVRFEACGIVYEQTIDPEPDIDAIGVAILDITLNNVPGNCTELSYEFCADQGQQSYGVGGIVIYQQCFMNNNYDVSLEKTVAPPITPLNSTTTFTISITNNGDAVTDAIVTDVLPAGLSYDGTSYVASVGTFDGTTWTIGNMAVGATETLDITVTAIAEGIHNNMASIAINETEDDLTNNEDVACVSVPVEICDDGSQGIEATAEDVNGDGTTTYQWYVSNDNGANYTPINAADGGTAQIYTISQAGYYIYAVNNGTLGNCGEQLCCPIIVETTTCQACPLSLCIPVTVIKTE